MSKKSCPHVYGTDDIKIGHDFLDTWLEKVKSKTQRTNCKEERDRDRV